MISEADTSSTGEDCTLIGAATILAQMGMDVVPATDKWDYELHWTPPTCGDPIMYYVVELRYAVFDTSLSVAILDDIGIPL